MTQLKRNNQIAHPDKFDRYFQLDIDCLSYRTADVKNVIYNFNEDEIIDFLLMQDANGTSYELLEDIQARISELSDARAKVIISALLKPMKDLNKLVYKSWLSINAGFYAKHMMFDLMERIHPKDRVSFISKFISSNKDALQSIATIISILGLGYERLSAEDQEADCKEVITQEERFATETVVIARVKEILKTNSWFDFSEWRMVYRLLNSFDPEYTKNYLKNALIQDKNVLWFLGGLVDVWADVSGKREKEYEVQKAYTEYFSAERALNAIESCRKDGILFKLPEELQHKCAAFVLSNSAGPNYGRRVHQNDTMKLISSWK